MIKMRDLPDRWSGLRINPARNDRAFNSTKLVQAQPQPHRSIFISDLAVDLHEEKFTHKRKIIRRRKAARTGTKRHSPINSCTGPSSRTAPSP
jgi:hypothetical protein